MVLFFLQADVTFVRGVDDCISRAFSEFADGYQLYQYSVHCWACIFAFLVESYPGDTLEEMESIRGVPLDIG